jgi:DNA-binding HxlR family transcriptional regulator
MASRRLHDKDCDPVHCPIEVALEVIGGMWKVIVVRELLTGTKRYSELHRGLRHATHKMLAQQLRQLEHDGIVDRKVYPQVPPKVEYSLTKLGRELGPLLDSMSGWGRRVLDGRTSRVGRSKAAAVAMPPPAARAVRTPPAMTTALRAGRR